MKITIRVFICAGVFALLLIAWTLVLNTKSTAEKQLLLINEATSMMSDGIYIKAVVLLEEAAGYDSVHSIQAENELKKTYLSLIEKRGFSRKYSALLDKQMSRKIVEPNVFIEAAEFYLSTSKVQEALNILKTGIEKTGDAGIISFYESSRYVYEINRTAYENATAIFNKTIQVQQDGKWGIASDDGVIVVPCIYDKISTFDKSRTIVKSGDEIYSVDRDNNRVAIADKRVIDFNNFAENRVSIFFDGNWVRATGDFELGSSMFEDIGMYSGGYAAAKTNGKWGVIDLSDKWLIPAEFDEIIVDELGRCYAQDAVFVRRGNRVFLFSNGTFTDNSYEDAHPFGEEGFAAVKLHNKWGYIDKNGNEIIPYIFETALSFGQHMAAVKIGDYWGYINIKGEIVIEPIFHETKSFSGGCAPVLTERGWQILTLLEYKKGVSL